MKVLAIDPGYGRCGVAVIDGSATSQNYIYSDCIETDSSNDFFDRLQKITETVDALITEYGPDALAIEKLFFNQNTTTAMKVAQVKGAIAAVAKQDGLHVHEYGPQKIKAAVAGSGNARKKQVIQMTQQLVSIPDSAQHDDEYDAVAVGITCLAHES
jgi:crossover junction endodeoxyribonuclease RuvC